MKSGCGVGDGLGHFSPESSVQLQDFQKPPFVLQLLLLFFVLKNYIAHHFFKRGRRKRRVLTGNCLNMNSFSSFLSSDGNETSWNSDENTTENSQVQLQLFYLEKRTDSSLWDKNVKML